MSPQRKSLKSGSGSVAANVTAYRAAKLASKSWYDKKLAADAKYVALCTDLATLDGKYISGDDAASRRKSFRRQVRNAVKSAFPSVDGNVDEERNWQILEKDFVLPHGLVAHLADDGRVTVRKFELPKPDATQE
jgi:hypothetical protein